MTGSMAGVVAAVRAAIDAYTRRHRELLVGIDRTKQVLARIAAVTTGSTHAAPREAQRALERSRDELEASAANAGEAVRLLTSYLASLESTGGSGNASKTTSVLDRAPVEPPERPTGAGATTQKFADFRSDRLHPDAVAQTKEDGWPKNAAGTISARARLYDKHGYRLSETAYVADDKTTPSLWSDLKRGWNESELTTTWHAEGRIAKDIRDSKLTEASVYLNVPVCGAPRPGQEHPHPHGCVANFQHIIPKDTVVYVFTVPEKGSPRRRRIVGTGEGIK